MHGFSVLLSLWERGIATIPEWLPRPHTQRPRRNVQGHFPFVVSRKFGNLGGKRRCLH